MKVNKIFLSLVFLFPLYSHALVDMNSASYVNSWVDLELPGSGYDMKVLRTYKSRSIYNGMFGFGWCSDFETKLDTTPEGNISISECGDGKVTLYSAKTLSKADVAGSINQIIAKMKADPKLKASSTTYWKNLTAQLFEDDDKRSDLAKQYRISEPVKEGIKYMANGKEVESVVLSKSYYTRTLPDNTSQRFDLQGRLTHMYDKNGNYLKFEYDSKGLLAEIEDNNSRKLSFKYYSNRKVKSASGAGLVSEYKYNNQDDLIWNKDGWSKSNSQVRTYEYNEFHNMTKATWPDKTYITLKYNNIKDWVIGFTDREKCNENYKYEFSKTNPSLHYWSTVVKNCGKEVVAKNKYEFWHKQLSNGQIVLARVLTSENGSTRDITYHDVFGKPTIIKKNNERIDFEYYSNGLVQSKISSLVRLDFSYENSSKKVSQVKTTFKNDKGKVISTRITNFKYDNKGNMTYADNTDGQKINMTYDNKGRISSITDQAKKVVKIDYDDRFGKPSVINRPGLGTVKVNYKSNGDIAKVDSAEGPVVASQVASTFNNLLDIIAPATQELYL